MAEIRSDADYFHDVRQTLMRRYEIAEIKPRYVCLSVHWCLVWFRRASKSLHETVEAQPIDAHDSRMEEMIAKEQTARETIQQLEFDYLAFKRERSVADTGQRSFGLK